MKADAVNRWLTLGANLGVLVGIILLIAELNQNSVLMSGQIFNERAGQGIDLFMSVAESPELSDIIGVGFASDTSESAAEFSKQRRPSPLYDGFPKPSAIYPRPASGTGSPSNGGACERG